LTILLVTALACQPADRSAGGADTTTVVRAPRPADTMAAPRTARAGAPDAPAASPQLLVPGNHYSGRVNTVTGETWLGLFRSDSGWALETTDVTVVAIPNPCTDTGNQKTGRRVGVSRPDSPLFLVRNAPSLEPGAAQAAVTGVMRLYPGERREFDLGSPAVRWAIAAYGSVPAPRPGGAGDYAITEYSLVASRTPWTTWEPLFTFRAPDAGTGLRSPPTVLWAGDVSGDGNLDVFMDLTAGDLPGPLALYLSYPGGSQLMRKVAEYQPGHCVTGDERVPSPGGDSAVSPGTRESAVRGRCRDSCAELEARLTLREGVILRGEDGEDRGKAGDVEHLPDRLVQAEQAQPSPRTAQPLGRGEQDAQPGAADVVEHREVDQQRPRAAREDPVQGLLRLR